MYDAVIVGAGPAGSAVAIHLARAGYSVALLDRAEFPRPKVCGEGLFPVGAAELSVLGAVPMLAGFSSPITAIRFHAADQHAEAPVGSVQGNGLGVQRTRLDAALFEIAAGLGVEARASVEVRGLLAGPRGYRALETDAGPVNARVVVAADGLQSRLRRQAGLDGPLPGGRYGINVHVEPAAELDPAVDVWFEDGWELYLTPVGPRCLNVAMLTRRPGMRRFSGDLAGAFEARLRSHPGLRPGFRLLETPRAAGPFPRSSTRAWHSNLVLAGDAAGFFDGISGEGLSLALVSARECARAVAAYLETGNEQAFAEYDRRRRGLARPSELLARVSLTLGRWKGSARRSVGNLSRHPDTFARLVAVNAGEQPLTSLRLRDILALSVGL